MSLMPKNVRLVLLVVLITLLVVGAVQNSASVPVSLVAFQFELPLFLVILGSALIGFGLGRLMRRWR